MMVLERVQKIIANNSKFSRRKAEELIKEGKVKVNGKIIKLGDKTDITKDKIELFNKPLKPQEKIYLMLNKPKGILTTKDDPQNRKTIFSLKSLKPFKDKVFPVGRLDAMTEGLLLLTNDGDFANKITHPRYETKKTYVIRVDKPILKRDITRIENGVMINGKRTSPAKTNLIDEKTIEITIHEGRNRIIRHILEKMQYKIYSLKRTKIDKYKLEDLEVGKIKKIKP